MRRALLERDRAREGLPAAVRVQRVEVTAAPIRPATAGGHVLAGLNPGRLPVDARATALADIGSKAGNGAVTGLVARARADFPLGPPQGVRDLRKFAGGGQLGHCRTSIPADPPLFRLAQPETVEGGFSVRPLRTRARELDFEVRYPTPGRHLLFEGRTEEGAEANTWLEVTQDWSARLLKGEEEHVADQSIARRDTWVRVAEATNKLADGPPIVGASPDDARRAAWTKFRQALPALIRPSGAEPTEAAQLAKWDPEAKTSVYMQLHNESARARDKSNWHTPSANLDHMEGASEIRKVEDGNSKIPGPLPEDVMKAAWDRLASAASGGGGGGRRGRR
jgi:hypothetical protein